MTNVGASDAPSSPVGLGARLRALREATHPLITQTAAARLLPTPATQNKISRMESGSAVPAVNEVRALCRAYGATSRETRELVAVADALAARTTSARTVLRPGGTASMQRRIGAAESAASHVRSVHPSMVLGVLQCEPYIRATFGPADPDGAQARIDRTAELRDNPRRRWTLIQTSGALLWNLAGAAVMAEQIEHMIALSERPNVDFRLITHRESTGGLSITHGWHIYDDAAVQVGITSGTTVLTDRADVRQYRARFDELAELAVSGDTARERLARFAMLYREGT